MGVGVGVGVGEGVGVVVGVGVGVGVVPKSLTEALAVDVVWSLEKVTQMSFFALTPLGGVPVYEIEYSQLTVPPAALADTEIVVLWVGGGFGKLPPEPIVYVVSVMLPPAHIEKLIE